MSDNELRTGKKVRVRNDDDSVYEGEIVSIDVDVNGKKITCTVDVDEPEQPRALLKDCGDARIANLDFGSSGQSSQVDP